MGDLDLGAPSHGRLGSWGATVGPRARVILPAHEGAAGGMRTGVVGHGEKKPEPNQAMRTRIFGNATIDFSGHTFLERAWLMEAEIHRLLWAGEAEAALAQNCANLRALATAAHQDGVWKGAWEYTYLPDPRRNEGGVSITEKASIARHLRETAAVDKIVDDAREEAKKERPPKHKRNES